jgi:hypothetical protein
MTAKQQAELIGKTGHIITESRRDSVGLSVDVRIVDVRQAYGKTQFQITPLSGNGLVWIDDFRFTESVS